MVRRHRASTISSEKRAQPALQQPSSAATAAGAPHQRGYAPHGRSSGRSPAPTKPTRASWLRTEGALRQAACEGLRTLKAALAAAATAYTAEELRIMLAVNGTVRKQCCSLDGTVSESAECGVTGVFVTAEDGYDAALNSFKVLRLDAGVGGKYAKARREASALHVAVVLQHWDVVRHLVEAYGCSVHDPAACGASALQMAATNRTVHHLVPLLSAEERSAVSPRHGGTRQPIVAGDDGDDDYNFDAPQPPSTSTRRSSFATATATARAVSASASKPCNPLKDRAFLAGTASAGDVAQAEDAATGGGVMSKPSDIAVQYLGRSASDPFGGSSGGGDSRGLRRPRPPTASSFVLRRHPVGGGGDAAPAVAPQAHSPPPKPRAKTGERSHKAMLLRYGSVDAPYAQSVVSEGESSSSDEGEGEGSDATATATATAGHTASTSFAAAARPASQRRLRQPVPPAPATLPQQQPPPPAAAFGRPGSLPSQLQRFPSAQSVASMLSHQRGRGGDEPADDEEDDVGVSSEDGGYNPLGRTVYAPEFEVQIREEQLRRRLGPKLTSARLKSAQAAGKLAEKRRRHADARATRHSAGGSGGGGRGGGSRAVKKAFAHSPYLTRKIDSFLRGTPPEPYSDAAASGDAGPASETSATWQYLRRRDSAGSLQARRLGGVPR